MRELPVMAELIRRGHKVTVVTGKEHARVTDNYLGGKAELIVDDTDAGLIVYPGTILIDTDSTIGRIKEHIAKWDRLIEESVDADAYIVDICPWAVIAAKKKGIPCFLMTNFTWIEQYESFVPDDILNVYKDAYRQADKIVFFDLANKESRAFFKKGFEVGFSARPFDPEKVKAIKYSHSKPIVPDCFSRVSWAHLPPRSFSVSSALPTTVAGQPAACLPLASQGLPKGLMVQTDWHGNRFCIASKSTSGSRQEAAR